MNKKDLEAFVPSEMAERAKASGIRNANRDLLRMVFLSIQAGAFIAIGAAFYTSVVSDNSIGIGITNLIGGLAFSLGLILVVIAGADLFTGDTLMVMASFSKEISFKQMFKCWFIVFIGNFIGAISISYLIKLSGQDQMWIHQAVSIATKKIHSPASELFFSGILCNMLVCLAIWLCYSAKSVTDKILAIIVPITAFVALGFEHSVANMYLLQFGNFNFIQILENIMIVTIGNIIGGGIFVGTIYWILYLRPGAPKSKSGFEV